MGVKLVSFGFAGQGRAIMRGPMVSGVINQLLTTAEWYAILFYTTKREISVNSFAFHIYNYIIEVYFAKIVKD